MVHGCLVFVIVSNHMSLSLLYSVYFLLKAHNGGNEFLLPAVISEFEENRYFQK